MEMKIVEPAPWVQIPAQPVMSCVTLGKLPNLSVPPFFFSIYKMRMTLVPPTSYGYCEIKWGDIYEALSAWHMESAMQVFDK